MNEYSSFVKASILIQLGVVCGIHVGVIKLVSEIVSRITSEQ